MVFRKCFYRLRRDMFCVLSCFSYHEYKDDVCGCYFFKKAANALCGWFIIESTLWMFTDCHPWSLNMMPRKQVRRWSNRLSILFWVACCILDYRYADHLLLTFSSSLWSSREVCMYNNSVNMKSIFKTCIFFLIGANANIQPIKMLLVMYFCTTVQKFGTCNSFFFFRKKEINTFIQQGCIKLIESNSKDIYIIWKIFFL